MINLILTIAFLTHSGTEGCDGKKEDCGCGCGGKGKNKLIEQVIFV